MRFVVVYQREPHARQMAFGDVPQPKTHAERVALARRTLTELELDVDVWIDDMGDPSRAMFGDLPHPAIVIDPVGTVQLKLSWCDPRVLALTLPEVPVMIPSKSQSPAEAHFLERIAQREAVAAAADGTALTAEQITARHHRDVMLANLATRFPDHQDRREWLAELADNGPAQQRAWAGTLLAQQLSRPAPADDPPSPANGGRRDGPR